MEPKWRGRGERLPDERRVVASHGAGRSQLAPPRAPLADARASLALYQVGRRWWNGWGAVAASQAVGGVGKKHLGGRPLATCRSSPGPGESISLVLLAGVTKKAGSRGHGTRGGPLSEGPSALAAGIRERGANELSRGSRPRFLCTHPGKPVYSHLTEATASLWLPGFYPESPAIPARAGLPSRDAPRALAASGRVPIAPPSAPG